MTSLNIPYNPTDTLEFHHTNRTAASRYLADKIPISLSLSLFTISRSPPPLNFPPYRRNHANHPLSTTQSTTQHPSHTDGTISGTRHAPSVSRFASRVPFSPDGGCGLDGTAESAGPCFAADMDELGVVGMAGRKGVTRDSR